MDNPLISSEKYAQLGMLIKAISDGDLEEEEWLPSEQDIKLLQDVLDYFVYLRQKESEL